MPGRAILCNANLEGTELPGAELQGVNLQGANLQQANLQGANLSEANLRGADLWRANLQNAFLASAEFNGAYLVDTEFQKADLDNADFRGADLQGANLYDANLTLAKLQKAELYQANLQKARLVQANVENARIPFSQLDGAVYAPASLPPDDYLVGITGLATVTFLPGEQVGLVQLRDQLKRLGLRDLEREATFAIEHGKALHARESGKLVLELGGWLQLIAFEWVTAWGLAPARALLIMLGLMVAMTLVYAVPIANRSPNTAARHGIFRIWPRERLEPGEAGMTVADDVRVERLTAGLPGVFAWAFYFSMLSAFHIGWRELNVGNWLTRMQFTEFTLRARGWVRFVSGLQSLISVYLVALWMLTYFGRPFQ